jgi:hypothetical protein
MNISELVPSQVRSFVYEPTAEQWSKNNMNKGRGENKNPLFERVTVKALKSGQVANMDMYIRKQSFLDPSHVFGAQAPQREALEENPCVFKHLTTGKLQVMLMSTKTRSIEYFVDGKPATAAELSIIESFRKARQLPKWSVTLGNATKMIVEAKSAKEAMAKAKAILDPSEEVIDADPLKVKVEFPNIKSLSNVIDDIDSEIED